MSSVPVGVVGVVVAAVEEVVVGEGAAEVGEGMGEEVGCEDLLFGDGEADFVAAEADVAAGGTLLVVAGRHALEGVRP